MNSVLSLRRRHAFHHGIDRAITAYAQWRHNSAQRAVHSVRTQVSGASNQRALTRQASTASGTGTPGGRSSVTVNKVHHVGKEHGKTPESFPAALPGNPRPDSDNEDGSNPSSSFEQGAMSKRNRRAMAAYGLKIQQSGAEVGYGLFAGDADLPVGLSIPAKGPWFGSREECVKFLTGLHPQTAEQMKQRVVQVNRLDSQGGVQSWFKIVSNVVGFVNDFHGVSSKPNATLQLQPGEVMDDYNLKLAITSTVRAGKEVLLNYGPSFVCGVPVARKSRPVARVLPALAPGNEDATGGQQPVHKRRRQANSLAPTAAAVETTPAAAPAAVPAVIALPG